MLEATAPTRTSADDIASAVRYLRHFAEAFDHGATLCRPNGESLFIAAATLRAAMRAEVAR